MYPIDAACNKIIAIRAGRHVYRKHAALCLSFHRTRANRKVTDRRILHRLEHIQPSSAFNDAVPGGEHVDIVHQRCLERGDGKIGPICR